MMRVKTETKTIDAPPDAPPALDLRPPPDTLLLAIRILPGDDRAVTAMRAVLSQFGPQILQAAVNEAAEFVSVALQHDPLATEGAQQTPLHVQAAFHLPPEHAATVKAFCESIQAEMRDRGDEGSLA